MKLSTRDEQKIRGASQGKPVGSQAAKRVRFYLATALIDILIVGISFGIANSLRFAEATAQTGLTLFLVLAPLYFCIAASANVYSSISIHNWKDAAWRAFRSYLSAITILLFFVFFLKTSSDISRAVVATGSGITLFFLVFSRFVLDKLSYFIFSGSPFRTVCINDGAYVPADTIDEIIDAKALGLKPDVQDPHALNRIGNALKNADRVVIYCSFDNRIAWATALKGTDLYAEIVVPELDGLGSLGADTHLDLPTLVVAIPSLDMRSRVTKRAFDIVIASLALAALAPIMTLIACAIRLSGPGPIFFVQPRLGRGNRLFPMYKFRSMRLEETDLSGAKSTGRDDPRVTRVGRIIRATSIDELPQFWNVLIGHMSVVGPRPHALGSLAGDKLFWEIDQRYWQRHAAKPGITGLAQIRGHRGATIEHSHLIARLQSDLEYLSGWSLWRDISIMFATIWVIKHDNAY